MSTNTLMPQVQRLFPHYVIFISHYFKPGWFNLIKLRLIEWWWFGWWFQRVNSFFQQINKSCLHFLHYLYSVEVYVFIRHIGFNAFLRLEETYIYALLDALTLHWLVFSLFTEKHSLFIVCLFERDLFKCYSWNNSTIVNAHFQTVLYLSFF